jgi:type IV pilus assembly protein PilE
MKGIFNKGFTLIELLIVIAILGIIIAAVIAGIDPVDKINAANDAKVQADIGAVGTAMEAYAALNNGSYATSLGALTSSGDLKVVLTPPTTNYSAYSSTLGCTTAPCTSQSVWSQQKSKRYTASPFWMWCSTTGHSAATAATTTCP